VGDVEMDEPESLGAITVAAREKLNNLIFVINCNLRRLDGPVRGNGKIIQELEAIFRGAGWKVIKVLWGSEWDILFKKDKEGILTETLNKTLDGQFQKYAASDPKYFREHFFGQNENLRSLRKTFLMKISKNSDREDMIL
jgi:pyruvate dehydrogenase E1 component